MVSCPGVDIRNCERRFATSADATQIGFLQMGSGPSLIIVHGMMECAHSHLQLAAELTRYFTIYLPDRRGRGASDGYRSVHGLQQELDDVSALLQATGAQMIFGVSAGGLIALRAACAFAQIRKVAVFDPVLSTDGPVPTDWLPRYCSELERGGVAAALVTAMLGVQMGPPFLRLLPRFVLEALTSLMMKREEEATDRIAVTMRDLAPTIGRDAQLVIEAASISADWSALHATALLLGGRESPAYFKVALQALERVFPGVRRVEFANMGHGGSGNRDRGGQPGRVAEELLRFFR
jgi:pimeloyl-ACP methyl ester carboxylesterase